MEFLFLFPLGIFVGLFGTLIGAGGGFLLIPVLLFLHPDFETELITGISLAVVFVNALAGSVAYGRMGRIHYRSGLLFASATIPGAVLGVFSTAFIPRMVFDLVFGCLLVALAIFLTMRPELAREEKACGPLFRFTCTLTEKNGVVHTLSYNYMQGVSLSLIIGYFSTLLGVGGGIIHVPVLVCLLGFPTFIATATSQFMLMIMSGTATAVHIATGTLHHGVGQVVSLAAGVLLGAPLGAQLSCHIKGSWVMRFLAFALILVGIRTMIAAI